MNIAPLKGEHGLEHQPVRGGRQAEVHDDQGGRTMRQLRDRGNRGAGGVGHLGVGAQDRERERRKYNI